MPPQLPHGQGLPGGVLPVVRLQLPAGDRAGRDAQELPRTAADAIVITNTQTQQLDELLEAIFTEREEGRDQAAGIVSHAATHPDGVGAAQLADLTPQHGADLAALGLRIVLGEAHRNDTFT